MDEAAAAAAINEDGAANNPRNGDTVSENNVGSSAEDTAQDTADGVFCCRDCGEAFREEAAYLEHRHQHSQENVYLDDQLDDLHDAEKDNETANFCTLCSLSFVEPSEFHLHMENSHGRTSQKEPGIQINSGITKHHTYECPDCGKCYGVIGHFLNHQRSHRQASKSVFHDLEHLKKKSFQCESCGRNYSRASALDAHRRCHEEKLVKSRNRSSGDACPTEESIVEAKPVENRAKDTPEKTFKCSCGKAFTALMRLKTHQRFSRNSQCSPEEKQEKPKKGLNEFYCTECKKAFSGHIALFNHQRWHENHSHDSAKRYPCEECGKVFMTLTFYYRHQRMAHSDETPAKSFLHQVCQLQKKAFECKDCGLKFSRASALHSHQLHHTDVFRETEKEAQTGTSLLPQQKTLESKTKDTEQEEVKSENVLPTSITEEDSHANETDEELESYEPGDFNVQVISASESEDEPVQDLNPDLELLCESDQEVRDDGSAGVSSGIPVSKPGLDLKIVQIDFGEADEPCALVAREAESKTTGERFDCPECYRWFSSASSLRVHRMWHGVRKRKQQTQVKQSSITCEDCGLEFTHWDVFKTHLHQHALEEEEEEEDAQTGDNMNSAAELDAGKAGENKGEKTGGDADACDMSSSSQTQPSGLTQGVKFTCSVCGKVYKYWSPYLKHQKVCGKPTKKPPQSVQNLRDYQCPDCGMSFIRRARLLGHLRVHRSFNSKPPRCDQCNKDFSSLKAWMAHVDLHKQRPFWCLSCAKGFNDEASLDEHLRFHSLKEHKCDICSKSFNLPIQLRNHYRSHARAKPYLCKICGKSFISPGKLIFHRRKHLRAHVASSGMPLGIKNSAIIAKKQAIKKQRLMLATVREVPEMYANMERLPGNKERMREEFGKLFEDADSEDSDSEDSDSEDSDCGDPAHHYRLSKPPHSAGSDAPDEPQSETVQPQTGQEVDESESQETDTYAEHKYWEWECIDCDMGFDKVEELHLHYIQHATGELPIPQDDM
ncbi:zinc finger protein 420 isoform X3 [Epinephelus moara]|uniref:zinc finger protein 420 isoform X3 n=1 Tax=Epinephelus moara TaxID=300413 RepID=UPI00214EA90D|nr:zinc finger protein 420 isoform X3 [Epinephelus moara]